MLTQLKLKVDSTRIRVGGGKKKVQKQSTGRSFFGEGQALLDICRGKKWPRKKGHPGPPQGPDE